MLNPSRQGCRDELSIVGQACDSPEREGRDMGNGLGSVCQCQQPPDGQQNTSPQRQRRAGPWEHDGPALWGGPLYPPSPREQSSRKHISKPKDLPPRLHCPDQQLQMRLRRAQPPGGLAGDRGGRGCPSFGAPPPAPACPPSPALQGADHPALRT